MLRLALLLCIGLFFSMQYQTGIPPALAEAGRWLALAAVGGLSVFLPHAKDRSSPKDVILVAAIAALCGAWVLSTSVSDVLLLSVMKLTVALLQIVVFARRLPRFFTETDWESLLLHVWLALSGIALVSLALGAYDPDNMARSGRLSGLSNPNSTAIAAMLVGAGGLWLASSRRQTVRLRALSGAVTAGSVVVLFLTGSRAGSAGFLVALAVWLWGSLRESRSLRGISAVAVLAVTVTYLARSESARAAGEAQYLRGQDLTYSRDAVWEASLASWRERPMFGWGYGVSAIEDITFSGTSGIALRDGSGYLGLLESVGVVGTVALALVLGIPLLRGYRQISGRRWGDQAPWWVGFSVSGMVALLVDGVAEPWILGPGSTPHLLLWLFAGAIVSASMVKTKSGGGGHLPVGPRNDVLRVSRSRQALAGQLNEAASRGVPIRPWLA